MPRIVFVCLCYVCLFATCATTERYKRADTACQRKIRKLTASTTRRMNHLDNAIRYEKETRQEMEERLQEDLLDLIDRVENMEKGGVKLNKTESRGLGTSDWRRHWNMVKLGLNSEKRKSVQFARTLNSLKSQIDAGSVLSNVSCCLESDKKQVGSLGGQRRFSGRLAGVEKTMMELGRQFETYRDIVDKNSRTLREIVVNYRQSLNKLEIDTQKMEKTISHLKAIEEDLVQNRDPFPCRRNNGGCQHVCKDQEKNRCSCYAGYILAANKKSCTDINECNRNRGGCDHICANTPGSFVCRCNAMFVLQSNGRSCRRRNQSSGTEQRVKAHLKQKARKELDRLFDRIRF